MVLSKCDAKIDATAHEDSSCAPPRRAEEGYQVCFKKTRGASSAKQTCKLKVIMFFLIKQSFPAHTCVKN